MQLEEEKNTSDKKWPKTLDIPICELSSVYMCISVERNVCLRICLQWLFSDVA